MTLNGRIAVVGLGSPIMTDDAIGLKVSEAVGQMNMDDVDCFQEAVGGLEVLPIIEGYSRAVFVDAIQTGLYGPGTVLIFDVADFESTVASVPSHDINIATALKIGRQMEPDKMPKSVKFVAIEIQDMQTMSEELTPAVAAAQGPAKDAVLHVIGEFRDQISKDETSKS